jgi:hypothetical protein
MIRRQAVNGMTRQTLATGMAIVAIGSMGARPAAAQDNDELRTITARVHGTFQDSAGGLGVVSGDMTIARFEVLNGSVTAIGRIAGAMADSSGTVLGRVDQELAFAVANVASTCNQLRMDLAATDAHILELPVHFDKEVAGFDSREGTTPKARPVLCATGSVLRGRPNDDAVMRALNDVVTALASRKAP